MRPSLRRHGTASRVKVCDSLSAAHPSRRAALKVIGMRVASLPAACLLTSTAPSESQANRASDSSRGLLPEEKQSPASPIVRDFADPLIELIRLLREASEIEHALMLQYLYAAASLKPRYQSIVGFGEPSSDDLLGVAIQEMQHLSKVNHFLRALGAAPNLLRQDFPFEPDIYPFAFNLEPLSRTSLAKYVFAEAPAGALEMTHPLADQGLIDGLTEILGSKPRANHIGSLYDAVLDTAAELEKAESELVPIIEPCLEAVEQVKREGEVDHYQFFASLFMGSHAGFEGRADIWDLAPDHPDYPARPVPINPSAYVGHYNQIQDSELLGLAWLSNLHYWAILLLLTLGYQESEESYFDLARAHMIGPLWILLQSLPDQEGGVPFDPLSLGYSPGSGEIENVKFVERLLAEADRLEDLLSDRLPGDYPRSVAQDSLVELAEHRS